ncbi:MAG TPA: hypothetical protein PKK99_16115 [Bacteroidia bacterium]|nr:hypothetical protein [Bacteroidia bacterium]
MKSTILDKDMEEFALKASSGRNLLSALLSLGLIIIAQIIYFVVITTVSIATNIFLSRVLIVLFYSLPVVAAILAGRKLKRCFQLSNIQSDAKNYMAMGISFLVLLGIANEIWHRLP